MPRNTQFRLVDLITLVAVMALFFSLFSPALLTMLGGSRNTQCQANLRSLAVGCLSYEGAYAAFPSAVPSFGDAPSWVSTAKQNGMYEAGPNWAIQIAHQLADRPLNQATLNWAYQIDERTGTNFNAAQDFPKWGYGRLTIHRAPSYMICPAATPASLVHSSTDTGLVGLPKGNYAACMGAGSYLESIDGSFAVDQLVAQNAPNTDFKSHPARRLRGIVTVAVIGRRSSFSETYCGSPGWPLGRGKGTKMRRIRDGTGKTALLSELLSVDGNGRIAGSSDDIRGVWITPSMGGSTYSHFTNPNSSVNDTINGCETDSRDISRLGSLICVQQKANGSQAGNTYAAARSEHLGGVNAATADGAVRFYSNDISTSVWAALATRDGKD